MRLLPVIFFSVMLSTAFCLPASAAGEFKANNPDGGKYEFLRSYIASLNYLSNIDQRWSKKPPQKVFAGDDLRVVRGHIAYLTMDNADLRISKNYVVTYLDSVNPLMRKVADTVNLACDAGIALNEQEKKLWQQWLSLKFSKGATPEAERKFVLDQHRSALQRKEIDKTIIEASVMAVTVAKSVSNADEKGHKLALTSSQRQKLLKRLDSFAKDVLDWGLKPGQSSVQASVSVIREVLEDPVYTSVDE